jgi:hypothetical protein
MLAAVAVKAVAEVMELAVQAVVEIAELLELQIRAVAVAAMQLAARVLSLLVIQILTTMPLPLLVRRLYQILAVIKFTDGQVQVQLLSKVTHGTFCTT